MKKIINGGVYAVDLHGTEAYEFKGVHPAIVVRTLKEQKMYYVVPLTTYTEERWGKCKRKGFGVRIISTNSIARVDKINVVSEEQIQSRYYNSSKLVVPSMDEFKKVSDRVEEYFVLSDKKAQKEYSKYICQLDDFKNNIEQLCVIRNFNEYKYPYSVEDSVTIKYPCNEVTYMNNSDIKNIIKDVFCADEVTITKENNWIVIKVESESQKFLTFLSEYDKFKLQKGNK